MVAMLIGLGIVWFALVGGMCGCSTKPEPTIGQVDGVVVEVDAAGLTDVKGFTLRPSSGAPDIQFRLGPLENVTQFAPGHLKEHQASGSPIRVYFTLQADGQRVVYRLEDALEPAASAPSVSAPSSSP